jgi:P pilus assembly chaperone PapD
VQENQQVVWQVNKINANKLRVKLINTGNEHVAISALTLADNQGTIAFTPKEINGRVLSANSKDWVLNLKRPVAGNNVTLSAVTDWTDKNRELNAVVPIK